jgi:hypothetical protein
MNYHITINKLEEDMKAQTLAKRTIVPHEKQANHETSATKDSTFFTKPSTIC